MKVWINGLSAGGGGGFTVAIEMARWLGSVRSDWVITLLLRSGNPLHDEAHKETFPSNVDVRFVEPSMHSRWARRKFELETLPQLVKLNRVDCLINLNGMVMGNPDVPTICHFQDPWAYRPEAWRGWKDRLVASVKRWQHRNAIARADLCTWTSTYLEDLILRSSRVKPRRSRVVYNGVPDHWVDRQNPVPLSCRPMAIATVSNVNHYKRQWLVVEAMAKLASEKRLDFNYRIVGQISPVTREDLQERIDRHGLSQRVTIEGRVSTDRLVEILANARVMPMMSVCESFGIPCIEAMSLGTPVIIADCCALPEVCDQAAEITRVDDVSGLADALDLLVHDQVQWQRLSEAGLERVGHFRWSTSMDVLASEIEMLVNTPKREATGLGVSDADDLAGSDLKGHTP